MVFRKGPPALPSLKDIVREAQNIPATIDEKNLRTVSNLLVSFGFARLDDIRGGKGTGELTDQFVGALKSKGFVGIDEPDLLPKIPDPHLDIPYSTIAAGLSQIKSSGNLEGKTGVALRQYGEGMTI